MRIDADRRTTRAYGGRALHEALEAEHEGTSSKIGEVIVNTLGRDHTLRHAYLRMRWHRDLALTSITGAKARGAAGALVAVGPTLGKGETHDSPTARWCR